MKRQKGPLIIKPADTQGNWVAIKTFLIDGKVVHSTAKPTLYREAREGEKPDFTVFDPSDLVQVGLKKVKR